MEPTPNQVGWVPTIGELYYGFNPISLNDSRIALLERPLVNGPTIFFSDFTYPEAQLCPIGAEHT